MSVVTILVNMISIMVLLLKGIVGLVVLYYVIKVLKVLYPFRWLIVFTGVGATIAYAFHRESPVNTYSKVTYTSCDNSNGTYIVKSSKSKGIIKLKSSVSVRGVCNELANKLPDISKAYRKVTGDSNYKVTITSANDGRHSNNSQHYKGRAFDLRVRDISNSQATRIAKQLKSELGDEYRIYWGDKGHKDHIHLAYMGNQ